MFRWLRRYWIALIIALGSYVWFILAQPAKIVTGTGSKIISTTNTSATLLEMAARQSIEPAIVVLLLGIVITWGIRRLRHR
ncbi:hypothetical protein [Sulfobacillus sp. hq2]|uniref:hypothetical protein n=1 Tax=Sulfobacillus TaxID=28033 RepID=UPI000CD2AF4C|nr:hypothetical protein [Sulfobacillus sp. hq2]POB10111.1 hypothetical protein CO251_11535 [Sulfobacillus sp. hq2]